MRPTPGVEIPRLRDPRVHLGPGQLATLARLRALGHLDLEIVGVDEVLGGHPEAPGRHLVDRRAAEVAVRVADVAIGVFATLAGVRLAAEAVHRDGEVLVRLLGDRPVRHRTGREALHDLRDRLHLVERHRLAVAAAGSVGGELEQPAQRRELARLVVDELRVLLVDVPALGAGRVLELEHGVGVEEVVLALAAPLVLATEVEVAVGALVGSRWVREQVTALALLGDLVESDAGDLRDGAREVLVDQLLVEPDRLEHLRAAVRRDGGDAHLRHDLQHALARRLDVLLHRFVRVGATETVETLGDQVLDRLEREVRVDRPRSVTDQEGHVVHFARVARLHDEPDLGARLLADEVVVDRRREEQRRDRRPLAVRVAVGEHEHALALLDRRGWLPRAPGRARRAAPSPPPATR